MSRREHKMIRRANRLIGDARFLVHHQYLGQAKLAAFRAINELELALFPAPLIPRRFQVTL